MATIRDRKQIVMTDNEVDYLLEGYFSRKNAERYRFEYDNIDLASGIVATTDVVDGSREVVKILGKKICETSKSIKTLEKEVYEARKCIKSLKTLSIVGFTSFAFLFLVFIALYMLGY